MILTATDFNDFAALAPLALVKEIEEALTRMPLPIKDSDQAGKQGQLIFDPKGANEAIKVALKKCGWQSPIPLPVGWQTLGLAVDFGKEGVLVEAQFSNYPFLLNNVMRANVLFNETIPLPPMGPAKTLIVISKAKLFPSANSTLYYEQALEHLKFLDKGKSLQLPTRLIGLTAKRGQVIPAIYTHYHTPRYSRRVVTQEVVKVLVGNHNRVREREPIILV